MLLCTKSQGALGNCWFAGALSVLDLDLAMQTSERMLLNGPARPGCGPNVAFSACRDVVASHRAFFLQDVRGSTVVFRRVVLEHRAVSYEVEVINKMRHFFVS